MLLLRTVTLMDVASFGRQVVTKAFFLFQLKRLIFLRYNSDLIPLLKSIQGFSMNYRKKHQVFDVEFAALPNQSPDPAGLHSDFSLQGPSLTPHSWMLPSSFSSLDLRPPGLLCHCVFVFYYFLYLKCPSLFSLLTCQEHHILKIPVKGHCLSKIFTDLLKESFSFLSDHIYGSHLASPVTQTMNPGIRQPGLNPTTFLLNDYGQAIWPLWIIYKLVITIRPLVILVKIEWNNAVKCSVSAWSMETSI